MPVKGVPGIVSDERGYMFSVHDLPTSDHFFYATNFKLIRKGDTFVILFGNQSSFSSMNHYALAIEIVIPMKSAIDFLFSTMWEIPSSVSNQSFGLTVQERVRKNNDIYGAEEIPDSDINLPEDPNCFRKFPANYVVGSISNDQALLEFFEASPATMIGLTHRERVIRPNSGLKTVVSVLMSVTLLDKFLGEAKNILEPFKEHSSLTQIERL